MIMKNLSLLLSLIFYSMLGLADQTVVVGSKKFTESVILGEIARLSLVHQNLQATHKAELGGTRILWNALLSGGIDIYPEYTGTIEEEILRKKTENLTELRAELKKLGIGVSAPLGFNNTYAVGMKKSRAKDLDITRISDLARHPNLQIGWGEEFRQRQDGWPGLKKRYHLPHRFVRGLDHDIAYRALENGDIDIIDLYSTDAEIQYYDLLTLKDDLSYFPRYEALFLYRLDRTEKLPAIQTVMQTLEGQINESTMVGLNRLAKIEKKPSTLVAADFLESKFGWENENKIASRHERIATRTLEHLKLVLISLFFSILAAIPLGALAAKKVTLGKIILWTISIIQTIPALALLVILIQPLTAIGLSGIGDTPAFIALFLYSLLPIVRSTHSGFQMIAQPLLETVSVLGLSMRTRLFRIEFPLALPSILSGIKTSAVMNVGFATLGALVGAGGYGQPILTGIRLDDYGLILEGAIPAAILAIVVQNLFDYAEKYLVSKGLR